MNSLALAASKSLSYRVSLLLFFLFYFIPQVSAENATPSLRKDICEEMSSKISAFQKRQGKWITSNCQHIQEDNVHYYGIHKNEQMQTKDYAESIESTLHCYQEMKFHVLQNMGFSTQSKVIQVVGDSASFSLDGTKRAKEFLKSQLTEGSIVLYGFTGYAESDGARCVNAAVSDVVLEKNIQSQAVANLVAFHTPIALQQWGCSGPELQHYVIVYGDDETCRENGTVFGDDVTTSDFFADSLLILDGGAQSFRQACNALLLDQNIIALSGLRALSKAFVKEVIKDNSTELESKEILTPYFVAAKFLQEVMDLISKNRGIISEVDLQNWYENYFGQGKCYVGNPKRGDFDTKQKLLDDAWDLFIKKKLYLKIQALVSFI